MLNNKSLYQRLLGDSYEQLPQTLQALHLLNAPKAYQGISRVEVGKHPLAKLMVKIASLPKAGEQVPLRVQFEQTVQVEIWQRYFDQQLFVSKQWQQGDLLAEKVGPLTFFFRVCVLDNSLQLHLQKIRCLGLPLTWCGLKISGKEWQENGLFHFLVHVSMPFVGQIISYQGQLEVEPQIQQ